MSHMYQVMKALPVTRDVTVAAVSPVEIRTGMWLPSVKHVSCSSLRYMS